MNLWGRRANKGSLGIYGYFFEWDIHHWFYDDSTLIFLRWISYFVIFFSNGCGAGGASAGGVVGAWSYPPKNIGTNTWNWEFFWGEDFCLAESPQNPDVWVWGLFDTLDNYRHIFISCSETDGATHAVLKSHLLRWWICGLYNCSTFGRV